MLVTAQSATPKGLGALPGSPGMGILPLIAMGIAAGISTLTTAITSWISGNTIAGNQRRVTTNYANTIEIYLKQNLAAWQALPADQKTQSNQTAALNNFNTLWNELMVQCNQVNLGAAGANCISDRQPGGKWDWWAYYYYPIANDTGVIADSVASSATSTVSSVVDSAENVLTSAGTSLGISSQWLLIGGLVIAAMALGGDKK